MKILVSGSTGLVGKALTKSLTNDGHEVVRLVRRKRSPGALEIEWHPNQGRIDSQQLEGLDAVVHLAGESIAAGRWTEERKRSIRESRTKGTSLLSEVTRSYVSSARQSFSARRQSVITAIAVMSC